MRCPFAFALAAAILAMPLYAESPAPDSVIAATVNGEAIRLEEVDAIIQAKFAGTPLNAQQMKQLRTEIVSGMIDDVLLRQFLRQYGPKIEAAEIDQHLKALEVSLSKRGKTLADFYRETQQSEAQVRETWTALLQLSGYVKQHVPDDQLKLYYEANKDQFDRVEVRVNHIMIRVGPSASATERAAARERLKAIRAEIAAGRLDFAAAAKKYSQCPSASDGGDLGYILRRGMLADEAFSKAAFALKVGEVSDVVEAEFGLHLIRVADRKPGTPSTFEKCLDDVRDQFTDDFRVELVAKLRKQTEIRVTVP